MIAMIRNLINFFLLLLFDILSIKHTAHMTRKCSLKEKKDIL